MRFLFQWFSVSGVFFNVAGFGVTPRAFQDHPLLRRSQAFSQHRRQPQVLAVVQLSLKLYLKQLKLAINGEVVMTEGL